MDLDQDRDKWRVTILVFSQRCFRWFGTVGIWCCVVWFVFSGVWRVVLSSYSGLVDPEDKGTSFIRNVGNYTLSDTGSHPSNFASSSGRLLWIW